MKIRINGKYYVYFDEVSVDTSLDAVASTFGFTARFDPDNALHKELFRPLSYHKVEFLHDDGKPISTGTLLTHTFNASATPELVSVGGYSLGGVLEDCQIPHELYPLESNNRSLKEIATRLLNYFGLKLIVYNEVSKECNQVIPKSVAEPEESIKDYLAKIAAQKNVIISHDVYGNVIMFRPKPNDAPKMLFTDENTTNISLDVNGQDIHSSITTLRQPKSSGSSKGGILSDDYDPLAESGGKKANQILLPVDTVVNPMIRIKRPKVDKLSSGDLGDIRKGAENGIASELKNISVAISINRWENISIGDMVEVISPKNFLYQRTKMMVSQTTINENESSKTSSITCVLPETFTGNKPKNIFA